MIVDYEKTVETTDKKEDSRSYKYSIIIMSVVSLFAYFYPNSLSPILSILAKEFRFTDIERDELLGKCLCYCSLVGSRLNTIYYLAGCPLSLLFSFIGDSNKRESIFILVSFVAHISSFVLPFFKSYTVLCWWRGISGAAVTSILPLYLSILSDMFPVKNRSTASVIATTVTCMGTLFGQAISGFFATRFGWGFFFRVVSVIGIITSIMLICNDVIIILCVVANFPRKGEAEMINATPIPHFEEKQIDKGFTLDMSIFSDSFKVPTNWISLKCILIIISFPSISS